MRAENRDTVWCRVRHVGSIAELNELLLAPAGVDDRRRIASRRITVGEHFALKAGACGPCPGEALDYTVRLRPTYEN